MIFRGFLLENFSREISMACQPHLVSQYSSFNQSFPPQIGKLTLFGCKLDFLGRKSINHFDSMASKNTFVTNEACGKRCAHIKYSSKHLFSPTFHPHAGKSVVYWGKLLSRSFQHIIILFLINIAKENVYYAAEWCWLLLCLATTVAGQYIGWSSDGGFAQNTLYWEIRSLGEKSN